MAKRRERNRPRTTGRSSKDDSYSVPALALDSQSFGILGAALVATVWNGICRGGGYGRGMSPVCRLAKSFLRIRGLTDKTRSDNLTVALPEIESGLKGKRDTNAEGVRKAPGAMQFDGAQVTEPFDFAGNTSIVVPKESQLADRFALVVTTDSRKFRAKSAMQVRKRSSTGRKPNHRIHN